MAAKKGGLGKGLNALFADNSVEEQNANVVKLKISEIQPNAAQPRKSFNEDALNELADSIIQHGILQPLLVRPLSTGDYQLVAGERRWRASRIAGLIEVPVIIREISEEETMEIALVENLQREDLNAIEESEGFQLLMQTYNLTQEQVANKVGRSRPAVTNSLRLLNLPEEVREFIRDGKLSAGHARALLAFSTETEMVEVAKMVLANDISVREVERLAKQMPKKPNNKNEIKRKESFFSEVEISLTEALGRKIKVTGNKGKGVLEIEFYSNEDLSDIANRLGKDY